MHYYHFREERIPDMAKRAQRHSPLLQELFSLRAVEDDLPVQLFPSTELKSDRKSDSQHQNVTIV